MLGAGIEPAWALAQGILSPSRLPVSPPEPSRKVEESEPIRERCLVATPPKSRKFRIPQHLLPMSYFAVSAVLVFGLDQMTKSMIQRGLENRSVQVGGIFRLRFLAVSRRHYRAAAVRAIMILVWCLAASAAALLALISRPSASLWFPVAMGAAVGGAAGNLLDVIRHRAVRDFIDLGWWPVFNVADIAIVAGIAGMLIGR